MLVPSQKADISKYLTIRSNFRISRWTYLFSSPDDVELLNFLRQFQGAGTELTPLRGFASSFLPGQQERLKVSPKIPRGGGEQMALGDSRLVWGEEPVSV
jgi:hypothetical protein